MALLEKLQQILTEKNTKITPENIKAGVKIFNIDGALNVPVKIFATKEAMMADTTEPDNELAMVYGPKTTKMKPGEEFHSVLFPSEITFDEEITDPSYLEIEAQMAGAWGMIMRRFKTWKFKY